MVTRKKRWSHSERMGLGSYERKRLLNRLNNPNRPQPSENLTRALECLLELKEIAARDPQADATPTGRETETGPVIQIDGKDHIIFGAPTRAHVLEHELNLRIPRYKTFSKIHLRKGKLKVASSSSALEPGLKGTDTSFVPLLLDAIVAGDFQKLARCEWEKCGKWLFKLRRKQRWCSGRCRRDAFASTPKFKADRRVYMKELREKNEAKELGIAVDKLRGWKLEARGRHIKFPTLLEEKRRAKKI